MTELCTDQLPAVHIDMHVRRWLYMQRPSIVRSPTNWPVDREFELSCICCRENEEEVTKIMKAHPPLNLDLDPSDLVQGEEQLLQDA